MSKKVITVFCDVGNLCKECGRYCKEPIVPKASAAEGQADFISRSKCPYVLSDGVNHFSAFVIGHG